MQQVVLVQGARLVYTIWVDVLYPKRLYLPDWRGIDSNHRYVQLLY